MTDEDVNKLRSAVKEEIDFALEPVKDRLSNMEGNFNDPKTGLKRINQKLDALWDQTVKLTEDMEEVKISVDNLEVEFSGTTLFSGDRIDSKFDRVIDTNIDYGNRLEDIEQVSVIAHELRLKRRKMKD